jgi:hypothetical protein
VIGPKTPSSLSPLAFCQSLTAAKVAGPNVSVSLPGEPGPVDAILNPF